jgi:hypothetical protein
MAYQHAQQGNCDTYAQLAEIYTRLAGKTDKSAKTRQCAQQFAQANEARYMECMAKVPVAAPVATAAPVTAPVAAPVTVATGLAPQTTLPVGTNVLQSILAALGVVPQPQPQATQLQPGAMPATPTQQRSSIAPIILIGGIGLAAVVGAAWFLGKSKRS